ncbi:DUF6777 domain-containing protein [Thermomonospora umbrina]|uniref:DUF6777 domain-containing protein n=1 Tax=Thermomonospora umbrina TaxID=111806 RepID=UPI000E237678|nr:DUF6777 domain-containing protein [Thermomonospora umbrina]
MTASGLAACDSAAADTITRLTVGSPGPDAYTLVAGTDRRDTRPRSRAGGEAEGDTPGLYGGTRNRATCDPTQLLSFLQRNPAKGKAWAAVQKVGYAALPRYIRKLTPVILRVDTLVTNHGYKGGKATSFPAVLQAGVAVLVDEYGKPVVKCNCGNPITPPDRNINPRDAKYEGPSWDRFTDRNVTVIKGRDASKGALTSITLVDTGATMSFNRPLGTMGGQDGPPAPLPPGETATPTGGPTEVPPPTGGPTDGPYTPPPGDGYTPNPDPSVPGGEPGPGDTGDPGDQQPEVPGPTPQGGTVPSGGTGGESP